MPNALIWLVLGWLPLWGALGWLARPRRFGGIAFGVGLAAVVGGICSLELQRHRLLGAAPGGWRLPPLGVPLSEMVRWGLCGLSGALLAELLLRRWPVPSESGPGAREKRPGDAISRSGDI